MKSFHYYAWPWDWEYENMRISRRLSVRRVETVGAADYRFRVYPPCAPLLKGDSAQKYISAGSGSSFSKFNNIYAAKPIHHTLCHCTHFSPKKSGPLSQHLLFELRMYYCCNLCLWLAELAHWVPVDQSQAEVAAKVDTKLKHKILWKVRKGKETKRKEM